MAFMTTLLLAAAAAAPTVEVVTLDGKKLSGTLQGLSSEKAKFTAAGKTVETPADELMHIAFPKTAAAKSSMTALRVVLTDGTSLQCTQITSDDKKATLESVAFGKLTVPATAVAQIRFRGISGNPKKEQQWQEYIDKKSTKDLLISEKPQILDFLGVVVANVTADDVEFAFEGMVTKFKRKDFFGIIFSREKPAGSKTVCSIELATGDVVQVSKIGFEGDKLSATLLAGVDVRLPVAKVRKLDFSLGKIKYLSDMEPTDVEMKPFFPDPFDAKLFQYRRNQTNTGKKLQLGKTTYERGLWIHSRTELKYRLGGEYRQFKAVMGIDEDIKKFSNKGHVRVVISGDGKTLLETTVGAKDDPIPVNLDVSKVNTLTILVDYGKNEGISDHLDLCEARVIK